MNWIQWLIVTGPMLPMYVFWVWGAEATGERRHWVNASTGLIVVPFFYGCLPFMMVAIVIEKTMEGHQRLALMTAAIALVFYAGLGGACYALRDRPAAVTDVPAEHAFPPR